MFFCVPSWVYASFKARINYLRLKEARAMPKLGDHVGLWIPWFLAASGWARPRLKPQSISIKGHSITRAGLQPRPTPVSRGRCRGWLQFRKTSITKPGDTEPKAGWEVALGEALKVYMGD